jgi:hypothetical protein
LTCTPTTIDYHVSSAVQPEISNVWTWFQTTLPGISGADPSQYCPGIIAGFTRAGAPAAGR